MHFVDSKTTYEFKVAINRHQFKLLAFGNFDEKSSMDTIQRNVELNYHKFSLVWRMVETNLDDDDLFLANVGAVHYGTRRSRSKDHVFTLTQGRQFSRSACTRVQLGITLSIAISSFLSK